MVNKIFRNNAFSNKFFRNSSVLIPGFIFLILVHSPTTSGIAVSNSELPSLTIYAYESLLNYGINASETNLQVFDAFESNFNCNINLEYFSDAGATMARVIAEKDDPQADIIIGIDNIMIHEAKKQDILIPYEPITKNNLSISAIHGLDSDFYATPYDFGCISLIYDKDRVNSSLIPDPEEFTLNDLKSPELAQLLVTEDPTLSSTGLGFLMWTIGIYEKVLDEEWTEWWDKVNSYIQVEKSWGDAFDVFYQDAANRPIMVSYATDPAYNYLMFDQDTSVETLLSHENDSSYAWLQIEGLGIIKGSSNLELAKDFIDWFTLPTVQELIPENNWMYPVNEEAVLPESFDYAVDPTTITPLNDLFTSNEISDSLEEWRSDWEEIMILGNITPLPGLFLTFSTKTKEL